MGFIEKVFKLKLRLITLDKSDQPFDYLDKSVQPDVQVDYLRESVQHEVQVDYLKQK